MAQHASERLLVVAAVPWADVATVWVARRAQHAAHGAGELEFVGGKVESGEDPRAALVRELVEEWGPAMQACPVGPVAEVLHHLYVGAPEVVLILYHVDARALDPHSVKPNNGQVVQRVPCTELRAEAFMAADAPFVRALAKRAVVCPFV